MATDEYTEYITRLNAKRKKDNRRKVAIKEIVKLGMLQIDIKEVVKEGWKVDKAKIKYLVNNIKDIQKLCDELSCDSRVTKSYESNNFKFCAKNYLLELDGGVLYVGIGSNAPNISFQDSQRTIVVEYNPQKIDLFKEVHYLLFLKHLPQHRRFIMYLDLAYDMYVNINDLVYYKRQKREYECLISHNELETIYLRRFGVNGSTRIYNKVLEKNGGVNEDLEESTGEIKDIKYLGECTRYEIRVKPSTNYDLEPFMLEKTIQLHKLSLKVDSDILISEIKKQKNSVFKNLLLVHLNMTDMLDKNKKNDYIKQYEDIKKTLLNERINVLNDYNLDCLSKVLYHYLNYIILEKESKILINPI